MPTTKAPPPPGATPPPVTPPSGTTPPAPPALPPAHEPPPQEPEYVPVGEEAKVQPAAKESWMAYTPEEITAAQNELTQLKPDDIIRLNGELNILRQDRQLPEAGGIAFMELQSKMGAKINITGRGTTTTEALINLIEGVKFAGARWGFTPVLRGADFPARQSTTNGNAQAQSAGQQRQTNETGTDVLNFIEVEAPGKKDRTVKFGVGKFKYPFTDARIRNDGGAETIAKLFDPALGWTPEHFAQVAYYTPEQYGSLFVDWECVTKGEKKYWNVIKVHA